MIEETARHGHPLSDNSADASGTVTSLADFWLDEARLLRYMQTIPKAPYNQAVAMILNDALAVPE
jgi:hypothetical protein